MLIHLQMSMAAMSTDFTSFDRDRMVCKYLLPGSLQKMSADLCSHQTSYTPKDTMVITGETRTQPFFSLGISIPLCKLNLAHKDTQLRGHLGLKGTLCPA